MTRKEFDSDCADPQVLKFLFYNDQDRKNVAGFLTAHVGLKDISWADTDMLRRKAGAESGSHDRIAPFYIGTFVVPIDKRGTEAAKSLLQGVFNTLKSAASLLPNSSVVCFFDCADVNNPAIPDLVKFYSQPSRDFPGVDIEVKEVSTDAWVRTAEGIVRVRHYKGNADPNDVVDKQHYYMVTQRAS